MNIRKFKRLAIKSLEINPEKEKKMLRYKLIIKNLFNKLFKRGNQNGNRSLN